MLDYCSVNYIIPQFSKCEFVVVNGLEDDCKPLPFGGSDLKMVNYITVLGSHLSCAASLKEELSLHMKNRYTSVIKFYNFIRSNKGAPLQVKTKVLKSCVLSSLLYNCETFGNSIPTDLESTYVKLLKCCFSVRLNTPNVILYAESGFLPIQTVIYVRQYKFYKRFRESIKANSRRDMLFRLLLENKTSFIQHYETLFLKYSSTGEIVEESRNTIKEKIYNLSDKEHYKYQNDNLSEKKLSEKN